MKHFTSLLVVIVVSYFLPQFFPWWTVLIAPLIAGVVLRTKAGRQFVLGFIALFFVWGVSAFLAYSGHAADLSIMIGKVFRGISASVLLIITAIVGGLYGGLAQVTGHYLTRKSKRV